MASILHGGICIYDEILHISKLRTINITTVDSTKALCPDNSFLRKSPRYKGTNYVDITRFVLSTLAPTRSIIDKIMMIPVM